MKKVDFGKLPTEQPNPSSRSLDLLSVEEMIVLMNREDRKIPPAIEKVRKEIAAAVRLIVDSLRSGGRIFFVGAGTSGRLGVMEAAELIPTFGTPPELAQSVIAGGRRAVFRSQEGAEDRAFEARTEIRRRVKKGDVVVGIAASGVTPFVQSALDQAKKIGARTALITCNPRTNLRKSAEVVIAPSVGPEIISGSTRLKSATATKMILNMLTTTAMVRLGKVYGNRMVDLQPKSRKLRERGTRLVQEITGLSQKEAARYFRRAHGQVKVAILMAKKGLTYRSALSILKKYQGLLKKSLARTIR